MKAKSVIYSLAILAAATSAHGHFETKCDDHLSVTMAPSFTTAEKFIWRGDFNGKASTSGILYVDGGNTYTAYGIIVSGTSAGSNHIPLKFTFDSNTTLNFTSYNVIDSGAFNSSYYIDIAFVGADENVTNAVVNANTASQIVANLDVSGEYARNITIGKGVTFNAQSLAIQTTTADTGTLTIDGTLNASGTLSTNSGSGFYTSNVVVNGLLSVGVDVSDNGKLNLAVNNGGAVNVTKLFETNGALTIASGATLTAKSFTLKSNATANINGTVNVTGGEFLLEKDGSAKPTVTLTSGAEINITSGYFRTRSATLDLVSGSTMTINNPYGSASITAAGVFYVRNGAELYITTTNSNTPVINAYNYVSISGKLVVEGGKWIAASRSGITLNTSDIELNGVPLALGNNYGSGGDFTNGGIITLNAGFTLDAPDSALLVAKQSSTQSVLHIKAGATAKLAGIGFWFNEEATKLAITLESGAKLLLTDLISDGGMSEYFGTLGDGDTITLIGFAENSIGIKNHTAADDALLSKINAEGVEQFYWVNDPSAGYWWLSTAIPEPADWAAIFALAALAAAIYRRRK